MDARERFLKAARCEDVDRTPVWFMRQAGRYQAAYRTIRRHKSLLDIVREPELAAQVTCLPVEELDVDAAILFSDIMVPLGAMGIRYTLEDNVGPVLDQAIRSPGQIANLGHFDLESLPFLTPTLLEIRRRLPHHAVIGFAGAPFTLASYLVEGRPSRQYLYTKRLMWGDPPAWAALMDRLAETTVAYLGAQVDGGVDAVQLFDSWVGALDEDDYRDRVLPWMVRIVQAIRARGVPIIYFGVGTQALLAAMAETGADVIGVDWRCSIADADRRLSHRVAIQGNLDPVAVGAPWPVLEQKIARIVAQGQAAPGHIFNLGHGVLPDTDSATLRRVVEWVHEHGERGRA